MNIDLLKVDLLKIDLLNVDLLKIDLLKVGLMSLTPLLASSVISRSPARGGIHNVHSSQCPQLTMSKSS